MKTPDEIAAEVYGNGGSVPEQWMGRVTGLMIEAIEADRAQHNMITALADVLDDRDSAAAAALVRDTDPADDLWNNYIGPMIDSVEEDYTALAEVDE